MPTYIYRREDGTTFEIDQRITEDALTTCPTTGQPVTRVITGGQGLIFKGSGFYLTDYVRNNGSEGGGAGEAKSTPDTPVTESKSSSDASSSPAETSSSDD